jgi:hypothetical protein
MDKVLLTSQAATLLVCLVAIVTLMLTAKNTRANAGTQKARFLLDLRNTFLEKHKAAADKVYQATWGPDAVENIAESAATTQSSPKDVPSTVQDVELGQERTAEATTRQLGHASECAYRGQNDAAPIQLELDSGIALYMGTLELCEVMLQDGLFDIASFYDALGYRMEQLAGQRILMDIVLPYDAAAGSIPYRVSDYWPKFAKLLWRVHVERTRRHGKKGYLKIGGVLAQDRIPKDYRPAVSSWWQCW